MWFIYLFIYLSTYFAMSGKNLPYIQDESCILCLYWWVKGEAREEFIMEKKKFGLEEDQSISYFSCEHSLNEKQ